MSSVKSSRRFNTIAVQSLIGAFCVAVYAVISIYAMDADAVQVLATAVPYFACFELGILSRYVPGVRSAAKRLD